MIYWKGVSFPLGMAIDLISLLWAILRSSHPRWPPLRIHYGPRTRRGKLVRLRKHLWWTSLLQILLRPISPLRTVSSLSSSSRSCLCSLWKVSPVLSTVVPPDGSTACTTSSTPTISSLRARSRSPCRTKRAPGPSATEERWWFDRGDWRSSWFAERQVSCVHSVPLFNNISLFSPSFNN